MFSTVRNSINTVKMGSTNSTSTTSTIIHVIHPDTKEVISSTVDGTMADINHIERVVRSRRPLFRYCILRVFCEGNHHIIRIALESLLIYFSETSFIRITAFNHFDLLFTDSMGDRILVDRTNFHSYQNASEFYVYPIRKSEHTERRSSSSSTSSS